MRLTVSGWELLGLHSNTPLCFMSTLTRVISDQETPAPVTWLLTTRPSCSADNGWWLKYQNMWWGGSGEDTVQLMVWEEPTLRYTDFSPTMEHWGSDKIVIIDWSVWPRYYPWHWGVSCDQCEEKCWPDTHTSPSQRPQCSETISLVSGLGHDVHIGGYNGHDHDGHDGGHYSQWCWDSSAGQQVRSPLLLSCLRWTRTDPRPGDQGQTCCPASPRTPDITQCSIYWHNCVFKSLLPSSCLHGQWYNEDQLCYQLKLKHFLMICPRELLFAEGDQSPPARENSNPSLQWIVLWVPDLLMLFHLSKLKRSKWRIKTFFESILAER